MSGFDYQVRQCPVDAAGVAAMSNLGLFGLSLLGLTIAGTLVAVIKSAWDEPWAWWEYAVLAAMVVGIGIAVAMAPVVTGWLERNRIPVFRSHSSDHTPVIEHKSLARSNKTASRSLTY